MARYERADSQALYSPTMLRLKTGAHRASLDGNEVAVLSGRDPKEYGSIGRMPGGKLVPATSPPDAANAYRTTFYQRRGVTAGHVFKTTTTGAGSGGVSPITFPVVSAFTAGVALGDWFVVYDANNCFIGQLTAFSDTSITLANASSGGANATVIQSGATVVRCMPTHSTAAIGATTLVTRFPLDLQMGQKALVVGHREGASNSEQIQILTISAATVVLVNALTKAHSNCFTIIPVIEDFNISEAFVAQGDSGAGAGDVYALSAGSFKKIWDASAQGFAAHHWHLALCGHSIFAVNGENRPRRISVHSGIYTATPVGQVPPAEMMGFPAAPTFVTPPFSLGSTSTVTGPGKHRMFVRCIDKSVQPYAKSPPIAEIELNTGTSAPPRLDVDAVIAAVMLPGFPGAGYRRATHLQIWMTTTGGPTYFLVEERHLSNYLNASGFFTTSRVIDISDNSLILNEDLPKEDFTKGMMPNGTIVHYQQGITFVGGASLAAADTQFPRILAGNIVFFSRTDTEEPENFPPGNFKVLGELGDDFRACVKAGDATVLLSRFSFTVAQRMGTFLQFFDGGGQNQGLAFAEAYASLGSHAAWVSDESIWLFNGLTQEAPEDIGFEIRDWVRGLKDAHRVRMGFDPVNLLLWVGKMGNSALAGDDTVAECMIYHFARAPEERAWLKRENVVLDAPFSGYGIETSTSRWAFYRMAGSPPRCFQVIDYDNSPLCDGGFNILTNTLSGTVPTLLTNVTAMTGINIPAGASNGLRGAIVHFITGIISEAIRVISASTATSITWTTPLTVLAGSSWIIAGIPFRLRFPPIRGQDPFVTKTIIGAQVMLDNIGYGGQPSQDASLLVKLLRDYQNAPEAGAANSLALTSGVAVRGRDRATKVQASGNVIEVQIEQLDRHVDFSLLYTGLPVVMTGAWGGDRNANV